MAPLLVTASLLTVLALHATGASTNIIAPDTYSTRPALDANQPHEDGSPQHEWASTVFVNQLAIMQMLNQSAAFSQGSGCNSIDGDVNVRQVLDQLHERLDVIQRSQTALRRDVDTITETHSLFQKRLDVFQESLDTTQRKMDQLVPGHVTGTSNAIPITPAPSAASQDSSNYVTTIPPPSGIQVASTRPGSGGLRVIAFSYPTYRDSFITFGNFKSFVYTPGNDPPFLKSMIVPDGETCRQGEAIAGIGLQNTGDPDKDDQRMYCNEIRPPMKLTSTCVKVTLSQEPRPNITTTNTAAWVNWLSCPDDHIMTKLYWTLDITKEPFPYRYSAVDCCLVISPK